MILSCSILQVFINPAIPAALSAWPILAFEAPKIQSYSFCLELALNASFNAAISIGSPKDVPVPWHSM